MRQSILSSSIALALLSSVALAAPAPQAVSNTTVVANATVVGAIDTLSEVQLVSDASNNANIAQAEAGFAKSEATVTADTATYNAEIAGVNGKYNAPAILEAQTALLGDYATSNEDQIAVINAEQASIESKLSNAALTPAATVSLQSQAAVLAQEVDVLNAASDVFIAGQVLASATYKSAMDTDNTTAEHSLHLASEASAQAEVDAASVILDRKMIGLTEVAGTLSTNATVSAELASAALGLHVSAESAASDNAINEIEVIVEQKLAEATVIAEDKSMSNAQLAANNVNIATEVASATTEIVALQNAEIAKLSVAVAEIPAVVLAALPPTFVADAQAALVKLQTEGVAAVTAANAELKTAEAEETAGTFDPASNAVFAFKFDFRKLLALAPTLIGGITSVVDAGLSGDIGGALAAAVGTGLEVASQV